MVIKGDTRSFDFDCFFDPVRTPKLPCLLGIPRPDKNCNFEKDLNLKSSGLGFKVTSGIPRRGIGDKTGWI